MYAGRKGVLFVIENACNDYGWAIPFTQIMFHKAEPA